MITFNLTAYGATFKVRPYTSTYANGRLCIKLESFDKEFEFWEPFATLTVNLPDQHLNSGEVFIKDWSENAPIVEALTEMGMLKPTGREVISGFVAPQVMLLGGPLLSLALEAGF